MEFVENLTVGVLAIFKNFRHHYTLVVNPVATSLASSFSAIRDWRWFRRRITTLIGNRWATSPCAALYQQKALFVEYLMHSHKRSCLEFAPVVLWAITNALLDIAPIADELPLLMKTMWKSWLKPSDAHGNVSKASQKLSYTALLQYRIDRFVEQTGLTKTWMTTLCSLTKQLLKIATPIQHRSGYSYYFMFNGFLLTFFVSL